MVAQPALQTGTGAARPRRRHAGELRLNRLPLCFARAQPLDQWSERPADTDRFGKPAPFIVQSRQFAFKSFTLDPQPVRVEPIERERPFDHGRPQHVVLHGCQHFRVDRFHPADEPVFAHR